MSKCSNYGDPLSSFIGGQQEKYSSKSAMAKSVQYILLPFLLISSICGLRIIELSAGHPKFWFSLIYIPLMWSVYCFIVIDTGISYISDESTDYIIYVSLNIFTVLLSILLGIYHDKVGKRNILHKTKYTNY